MVAEKVRLALSSAFLFLDLGAGFLDSRADLLYLNVLGY